MDFKINTRDQLAQWAVAFNEKHNSVDFLLKILRRSGHPDLPATARTLLKTTKDVKLDRMSGMDYIYLGLAYQIKKHVNISSLADVTVLTLGFNIDGLPLFKSSPKSLWPVLCGIMNISPTEVFPITLTYGDSKPSDLDFLSELIDELDELLRCGLCIGNKNFQISVQCIICDAPAKAFVKCTKLYSGYSGCDKCAPSLETITVE